MPTADYQAFSMEQVAEVANAYIAMYPNYADQSPIEYANGCAENAHDDPSATDWEKFEGFLSDANGETLLAWASQVEAYIVGALDMRAKVIAAL